MRCCHGHSYIRNMRERNEHDRCMTVNEARGIHPTTRGEKHFFEDANNFASAASHDEDAPRVDPSALMTLRAHASRCWRWSSDERNSWRVFDHKERTRARLPTGCVAAVDAYVEVACGAATLGTRAHDGG